jgi:hypothetical protein
MKTKHDIIKAQLQLYEEATKKRVERATSASSERGGQPSTHDNKKPPQDDK